MKRILITLMVIMTLCSLVNAQTKTTVNQDSIGKAKISISKTKNAKNTAITVIGVDTTMTDSATTNSVANKRNTNSLNPFSTNGTTSISIMEGLIGQMILIPIIVIIMVFGLPVFVLFLIFFFRYKNRKARYRLVEQALASGQPLPEGLIKEYKPSDQCSAGIRNIFTGIGLFVFLYAITNEFGIGAIGLLIMFMGIGQWSVGHKLENKKEKNTLKERFYEEKNQESNKETK